MFNYNLFILTGAGAIINEGKRHCLPQMGNVFLCTFTSNPCGVQSNTMVRTL